MTAPLPAERQAPAPRDPQDPQVAPRQMTPAEAGALEHPTSTLDIVGRVGAQAAVPAPASLATPTPLAAASVGTMTRERPPSQDPTPPEENGDRFMTGRLARLRIGAHTASRAALAAISLVVPHSGLVIGSDRRHQPVSVPVFRPRPTKVTVVGGAWAGQLMVFRALAQDARVAVVTGDPSVWTRFGEWATGRSDRVTVLPREQPLALTANAVRPALVVYDLGVTGPMIPPRPGPWQTQLTILRRLDHSGVPSIQDSQVVLMQRLSPVEAALAAGALRLPDHDASFLQMMADEMLSVHGDGHGQYAWLHQTDVEREYFGQPRR